MKGTVAESTTACPVTTHEKVRESKKNCQRARPAGRPTRKLAGADPRTGSSGIPLLSVLFNLHLGRDASEVSAWTSTVWRGSLRGLWRWRVQAYGMRGLLSCSSLASLVSKVLFWSLWERIEQDAIGGLISVGRVGDRHLRFLKGDIGVITFGHIEGMKRHSRVRGNSIVPDGSGLVSVETAEKDPDGELVAVSRVISTSTLWNTSRGVHARFSMLLPLRTSCLSVDGMWSTKAR